MDRIYIPTDYRPSLDAYDTQRAIEHIKSSFQREFSAALNLKRVSAPLFVTGSSGLNDDLNGVERPVSFDVPALGTEAQVVHSLAKWKRLALKRYGFSIGNGLYTDMNAIRRDEELDNIHSLYVDQWDWEKVILRENRNVEYLQETVEQIVEAIFATSQAVQSLYPQIPVHPCREISFVSSQELEDLYPNLTPKERENAFVRTHPTTFLMGIGGALRSGNPHDGRAPDYDDWNLNGDLLFWDETLEMAMEISSMGIRVDASQMRIQCQQAGCSERLSLPFHQGVLKEELPLSMGGGIGQSRLCMLLLGKAHIGEVQASLWPEEMIRQCQSQGILLL